MAVSGASKSLSLVAVSVLCFFVSCRLDVLCALAAVFPRHLVADISLHVDTADYLPTQASAAEFHDPHEDGRKWRTRNVSASFRAASSFLSAYLANSPSNPENNTTTLQDFRSFEALLNATTNKTAGVLPKLDEGALAHRQSALQAEGTPANISIPWPETASPTDKFREKFPFCPLDCLSDWPGDKWCDQECYSLECGMDGGDCEGWCTPLCQPSWLGDGQCDKLCYSQKCDWDGGDCKDFQAMGFGDLTMNQTTAFNYRECTCDPTLLGNGECDAACNTFPCRLDGLDCEEKCTDGCPVTWLGDGMCDSPCDSSACHFDKGDCNGCGKERKCRTWMLGNKICDPACNEADCNFDEGDCLGILAVLDVDYTAQSPVTDFCAAEFVGDGFCDWQCYNKAGMWDGGDCDTLLRPLWLNDTATDSERVTEQVRFLKKTNLEQR